MTKDEKRLVFQALQLLEIMKAKDDQPLANEIQGILYELLNRS